MTPDDGDYQAYRQESLAQGIKPVTVGAWRSRKRRAAEREKQDAISRATAGTGRHEHNWWRTPGGGLECACGTSRRPIPK